MKSPVDIKDPYRAIPSVQELLQLQDFQSYDIHPQYLKRIIQEELRVLRESIAGNSRVSPENIPETLQQKIIARLERLFSPRLRRVINASGIILHTNMGRAPLAVSALQAIGEAAEHYCSLEIDLDSGKRGSRIRHVEELLCLLTGAEAAMMVNNCAAAVLLVLNTLCKRREVVVSRGELVEIGGSFRMPAVMKTSGAKMVEIGTTNKTHLQDYREVLGEKTAAILKVHTSNYRILGFSGSVEVPELLTLARQHHLPLIYDMGSGMLEDLQKWGYPYEPHVREMLERGVDIVTFSGDKMLGGPQAGIILGKKPLLQKIKKNHLARALRCDKLIYAAMEATLRLYLRPRDLPDTLPLSAMLSITLAELEQRATWLRSQIKSSGLEIEIVESSSQMGSGAFPLEKIASVALKVTAPGLSPTHLARKLRRHHPPVVGYIKDDALLLNLRTVREDELEMIVKALQEASDQ